MSVKLINFVQAISLSIQRIEGNTAGPDEFAVYELAHLDLHGLQIQPFPYLALY